MRKVWLPLQIVGFIFIVTLYAAPAQAQASRTWVSGVGDDANPCSRTAPCKTFAGAISKTAPAGEINVLDPGGYGAVTITKPIAIISTFEAGVLVSGTNGIIVNVPGATDTVILEGLDFEGLGTGLDGVKIIGAGQTIIRKSSFRHFLNDGVNINGLSGARVFVEDSLFANNGTGLRVQGASGAPNTAFLQRCTLEANVTNSTFISGAANTLVLIGSTLSGTSVSINNTGGSVISYGDNVIRGTGVPTSTLPKQ